MPVLPVGRLRNRRDAVHQGEIDKEADQEADEPSVVVEDAQGRKHQADKSDGRASSQRRNGGQTKRTRAFAERIAPRKIFEAEEFPAPHAATTNPGRRAPAETRRILPEPAPHVTSVI